ncbi:hypothetical protein BD769DRAFT_1392651 [Suillus cothurnatus]|nr:hypothetical protein BD769DRAFT_1392651 [Suillus cothurnatus]
MPIEVIALTLTAIECCIDEWLQGIKEDIKFTAATYGSVYQTHLSSLQHFNECTAPYKLLTRIRENLHDVARCPFLFTVICAISLRYYKEKSEIYPVAMHFAKHSAANALIDGWKSVELCQAYILMTIYAVPARRREEDKSWLYTGLAARSATDLNLHQVPTTQPQTERQEQEMLNHTLALKFDIHLCDYSTLLRIVGRFHDNIFSGPTAPTGLNKGINFLQVTLEHDCHLTNYFEEWTRRFNEESDPGGMEASDNVFLDKCFNPTKVVIKQIIEVLAPSGLIRAAPDGHFVFASFASAFMLKLLHPDFAQLLARQMEDEIFELIGRLITMLQDVAIDERHTPRLYAQFLASLLTGHRKGGGSVVGHAESLGNIESGLGVVSVICSECFFILRIYALWNKNRNLLAAMLSKCISQAFVIASLIIYFTASVPMADMTGAIPDTTGCYNSTSSTSFQLFIKFLLLPVFQLGGIRDPYIHTRHTELADQLKPSHILLYMWFCA